MTKPNKVMIPSPIEAAIVLSALVIAESIGITKIARTLIATFNTLENVLAMIWCEISGFAASVIESAIYRITGRDPIDSGIIEDLWIKLGTDDDFNSGGTIHDLEMSLKGQSWCHPDLVCNMQVLDNLLRSCCASEEEFNGYINPKTRPVMDADVEIREVIRYEPRLFKNMIEMLRLLRDSKVIGGSIRDEVVLCHFILRVASYDFSRSNLQHGQ
jgi:hypothetical protein